LAVELGLWVMGFGVEKSWGVVVVLEGELANEAMADDKGSSRCKRSCP
jgi:hypothetical protein